MYNACYLYNILCCPCYMPKYVPRLEGIIHDSKGSALYLLTLGHISAYNMDNTIYPIILIFILSIHFRHISFVKITKDIQSNNNNNIVLSMLHAEICPKVRRYNALPFGSWIMPSNLGTYFGI
jgi:hypothetical protein